jgi:hypothetical protein
MGAPLATVVLFHHRLMFIIHPHNDTHGDKLANLLSFLKQLVDM